MIEIQSVFDPIFYRTVDIPTRIYDGPLSIYRVCHRSFHLRCTIRYRADRGLLYAGTFYFAIAGTVLVHVPLHVHVRSGTKCIRTCRRVINEAG